ncbi:iron ABC transporter permease [Streptococcaceae bacterium ESL0687]|nr:iron ABC transporter permease [Streptococcaceae bacterium ESL0687]
MKKHLSTFIILLIFFLAIFYSLLSGTYFISGKKLLDLLIDPTRDSQAALILWEFRLPRLILGALAGASLALAGYILQTITRNPVADSGLLGVSAGASFGSVLYYFLIGSYLTNISQIQSLSLVLFGLAGALLALLANLLLSSSFGGVNMPRFILNGIALNTGFSALTAYFSLKINSEDYSRINNLLEGSISQGNWILIKQVAPFILIILPVILLFQNQLKLLKYSDLQLKNIGFPTGYWRMFFILLAACLVCSSVLIAGNIAFVGLLVPHLTSKLFKNDSKFLLPGIIINGGSLVILCDTFAKTAFIPNELPLNAMMGLLGIPNLLVMFLQKNKQK